MLYNHNHYKLVVNNEKSNNYCRLLKLIEAQIIIIINTSILNINNIVYLFYGLLSSIIPHYHLYLIVYLLNYQKIIIGTYT